MRSPHLSGIIPPYLLRRLAQSGDPAIAARAEATLRHDRSVRSRRAALQEQGTAPTPPAAGSATGPSRTIGDAKNAEVTPGTIVRREGGKPTGDAAVDEAYDGFGDTWRFYSEVFGRNSIDGEGLALLGTVHYGTHYDNAFWDGTQMVFGDGDGDVFGRFTASVDVIGHELTHGVTEATAGLVYSGQSGALNESMSDVFGSLVKQHALGQTADAADWLIGEDLLLPGVKGQALRNMLHPGTAYDDPRLGKDPQPDHMSGFVKTTSDNGGVHLNSGIPNRAFALAAVEVGGNAWQTIGPVWWAVLTGTEIQARCTFARFAELTIAAARSVAGAAPGLAEAVEKAWATVGVTTTGTGSTTGTPPATTDQTGIDLLLRRTGGIAGLVRERQTTLDHLPEPDADHWHTLLTSPTLASLANAPTHPDGFTYEVRCRAVNVHLEVPEASLQPQERQLFQRTLAENDD